MVRRPGIFRSFRLGMLREAVFFELLFEPPEVVDIVSEVPFFHTPGRAKNEGLFFFFFPLVSSESG